MERSADFSRTRALSTRRDNDNAVSLVDLLACGVPNWHRDALCAEYSARADAWFAQSPDAVAFAKGVCGRCLVQRECLTDAYIERLPGIWGGTTERERNTARKNSLTVEQIVAWLSPVPNRDDDVLSA